MTRMIPVGDQAVVRAGFCILLEEHGDIAVVDETASSREAVAVVAREHPDAACMDLRMPAGGDLTATRQIVASRQGENPAVLVTTTFDLDADIFGTLEVGADGFILRDCEPEKLIDAIRRLTAGYELVDHIVTRRVITEFTRRHTPAGDTTEIRKPTARELEIVKLLAAGMSNVETATELVVKISAIKSCLTRILPKIDARDQVQVVM